MNKKAAKKIYKMTFNRFILLTPSYSKFKME